MTVRWLQAWLLALLLLSGGPLSTRICAACPDAERPAGASTDDAACCASERSLQDDRPAPAPGDQSPEQDCECPFGCCATPFAKAVPAGAPNTRWIDPGAAWEIPGAHDRAAPDSDGPQRPPKA